MASFKAPLDSDNDLEASSSSPLLPTSQQKKHTYVDNGASTRSPSLYRRLKLDYLSTAALLVIVIAWATGLTGDSTDLSGGREGSSSWPTNIGFEGPTPSEHSVRDVAGSNLADPLLHAAGKEPMAAATAYPIYRDTSPIRPPSSLRNESVSGPASVQTEQTAYLACRRSTAPVQHP